MFCTIEFLSLVWFLSFLHYFVLSIIINTRLFPRSTGNSHHQHHRVQGYRDLEETRVQPGAWRHHLQSRCLWHQEKYIIFISAKAHHFYFPEVHNLIFRMYIVFVSLVCFSPNARGIAFTGFSRTVTPKHSVHKLCAWSGEGTSNTLFSMPLWADAHCMRCWLNRCCRKKFY